MLILVEDSLALPLGLRMLTLLCPRTLTTLVLVPLMTLYGVEPLVRPFGQPYQLCGHPLLGFLPPNDDISHLLVPVRVILPLHLFRRRRRLA